MTSPREYRTIEVDRAVLNCEILGSGTPVIALHGGPGIGYEYLLPELNDSLAGCARLICYDQRASGGSSGSHTPELLNIRTFVDDLVEVYEALGISRAVLLGHSFGGLLAMHFVLQNCERVTGLILVDADPANKTLWARYPDRLAPQEPAEEAELTALRSLDDWQTDEPKVSRYFELVLKPFFVDPGKMPSDFGRRFARTIPENLFVTGPAVRASLGDWDLYSELEGLDVPVSIIVGDRSIYPEQAVTKLHEVLPNSSITTLHGVSHFPFIESPRAFREAVRRFIALLS